MSTEMTGSFDIQRCVILGLGYEGGAVCEALYRKLLYTFQGYHPPIVRYLVVVTQEQFDDLERLEEFHSAMTRGVLRVVVAADPSGDSPTSRSDSLHWLLQNSKLVDQEFNGLLRFVERSDHKSVMERQGMGITPLPKPVTYLVGALYDPFAGGLMLDLAYFITDRSIVRAADLAGREQLAFVSGIALLPGFLPDLQSRDEEIGREDREAALAYAALKELNYFRRGAGYECRYDSGEKISFDRSTPLFENGACLLVSPYTEQGSSGLSVSSILEIVGDWLGYRIASSAGEAVDMTLPDYASFGLSAWTLPRKELATYCSSRLIKELFEEVLLAPGRKLSPSEALLLRTELGITRDRVQGDLFHGLQQERYLDELERSPRSDAPLLDFEALDAELVRQDTTHRTRLDGLRDEARSRLLLRVDRLNRILRERFNTTLSSNPDGGLDEALQVFREVGSGLRSEAEQAEEELKAKLGQQSAISLQIRRLRARYLYAVRALGAYNWLGLLLPMTPIVLFFISLLLGVFVWQFVAVGLGATQIAALAVGAPLVIVLVLSFSWLYYCRTARIALLLQTQERRRVDWEIDQLAILVDIWSQLDAAGEDIRRDLNSLRNLLTTMARESRDRYEDELLRIKLYESPRHPHEQSVLTPQTVENFYGQLTLADQQNQMETLLERIQTPYYDWIYQSPFDLYTAILEKHIEPYIRSMTGFTAVSLLEQRFQGDELERILSTTYTNAGPMLDSTMHSESVDEGVQRLTAIYRDDLDSEVQKALTRITNSESHSFIPGVDLDVLFHLSMRGGIPIYEIPSIRHLSRSYEILGREGRLPELHTRQERIGYPDLIYDSQAAEGETAMHDSAPLASRIKDHRDMFVMASFLGLVEYLFDQEQYGLAWQSATDVYIEQTAGIELPVHYRELGATKEEAALFLFNDRDLSAVVRQEIETALREVVQDEYNGVWPLLARELWEYQRDPDRGLAEWERATVERFINWVRLAYPASEQTAARIVRGRRSFGEDGREREVAQAYEPTTPRKRSRTVVLLEGSPSAAE